MRKEFLKGMAILLATVVCISLTACGGDDDGGPSTPGTQNTGGGNDGGGNNPPAATTYSYYLLVSDLTEDNFRFLDYTYQVSIDGNTPAANPSVISGNGGFLLAENVPEGTQLGLALSVTAKENIASLMDKTATYQLADYKGIGLRRVASTGYTTDVKGSASIITESGRYLLSNIDYFTNTISIQMTGSQAAQTIQPTYGQTQPALHPADADITEGDVIDLGLSVKWASSNVTTTKQAWGQSYYAWAETEVKNDYTWNTYKYCQNGSSITKYNTSDQKTVLDASDDVAHVVLGGNWRMPSKAELAELISNCTWTWEYYQGHTGYQVKGKNGNSIFLPASGHLAHNTIALYGMPEGAGKYGSYWSREIQSTTGQYAYQAATILGFSQSEVTLDEVNARMGGCSVRAVLPE